MNRGQTVAKDQGKMRKDIISNEAITYSVDERTVCVSGLQEQDAELCWLYFDNERQSNGGEVEENGVTWDQEAEHFLITFVERHAAERVLSKRGHTVGGKRVDVKPWLSPPCYTDAVLITGIPAGTSVNDLADFLENVGGVAVDRIQFKETENKALVILRDSQVDLKHLQYACKMNPLDEDCVLSVKSVPLSHTVVVKNLNPMTQDSTIFYFFSNKSRNSGGPVSEVIQLDDTCALVLFENEQDARAIVDKGSHILDEYNLEVSIFQKGFLSASRESVIVKTKVIQVEGHIPSSAYKDTINDGPLIDRKQKFLEKVADIMLDTPAINEAAAKALSIFGDRLLNAQPVGGKKPPATDNFLLEVTVQLAFVSPDGKPLSLEGREGEEGSKGYSMSASAASSTPVTLQYKQGCSDSPEGPVYSQSDKAHQSYSNSDFSQQISQITSDFVQYQLGRKQGIDEHTFKTVHRELTFSPKSSGVPLRKPSTFQSPNYSQTQTFIKSPIACKERIHSADPRQLNGKLCAQKEMIQQITIHLGVDVVDKITKDKQKLRRLVTDLRDVCGRFTWQLPNSIVITATKTDVPKDWKERVKMLIMRKKQEAYL